MLKHADFGEADRLLTLYSREAGKLRALAKGARKPRSRKAGHLEPFTRVSLLLATGRSFHIVSQAEAIDANAALSSDLVALGYASYVVELLERFTADEDENRALYHLLRDTLSRLAAEPDPELVVRYYEVRLLDQAGFRPQLQTCLGCGAQIHPQDQYFSIQQGGVLCPDCGRRDPAARPISLPALKVLRHLQRSSYAEAARAKPSKSTHTELETLMQHYLTYLLERNLNSPRFLRQMRAQSKPAKEEG